jgi:hypothetical protein
MSDLVMECVDHIKASVAARAPAAAGRFAAGLWQIAGSVLRPLAPARRA